MSQLTDTEVSEMLKNLAYVAHEAVFHAHYANSRNKETEAHISIDKKLLELSKDLVLD